MDKFVSKKNAVVKYVLFFVNPILGFLISLTGIKSKTSYQIFFLFAIIFGISFTVPLVRTLDFTGDGVAYRVKFETIAKYEQSRFYDLFNDYIEFNEGDKDLYAQSISFFVSRFTHNYHWVFGVYAVIFAFFLLKSLHILTQEPNFKNTFYCFLLATIFVMSNSIFNINGVRFWTASWIGVYSLFKIFKDNDKRYLILAFITPFIHVSFFAYLFVLFIGLFSRKFNSFWFVLFILSFFISAISTELIKGVGNFLPEFISRTIDSYTDPEIIMNRKGATLWYASVFKFLERFIINLMVFFFYRNRKVIAQDAKGYNLYLFLLVWMTFVNFTMPVLSLGGRFIELAIPLIIYIWLLCFFDRKYHKWILIFLVTHSFNYAYTLKLFWKVTELEFYLMSPFYLLYKYLFLAAS